MSVAAGHVVQGRIAWVNSEGSQVGQHCMGEGLSEGSQVGQHCMGEGLSEWLGGEYQLGEQIITVKW